MTLFQLTPVPRNVAGRQRVAESNICRIFYFFVLLKRSEELMESTFGRPYLVLALTTLVDEKVCEKVRCHHRVSVLWHGHQRLFNPFSLSLDSL